MLNFAKRCSRELRAESPEQNQTVTSNASSSIPDIRSDKIVSGSLVSALPLRFQAFPVSGFRFRPVCCFLPSPLPVHPRPRGDRVIPDLITRLAPAGAGRGLVVDEFV